MTRGWIAILVAAMATMLAGCAGDGPPPDATPPPSFRPGEPWAVGPDAASFDPLAAVPGVVARVLEWLVDECFHEGGGFFLPPHDAFWTWDTVLVAWLVDGLAAAGFDVSAVADEAEDARAWLDAARKADGSFTFMAPTAKGSCTETTSLAALVVPDPATDAWIVGEQRDDGHWRYPYEFVRDPDYPSATVHALYAAACRDLPVDRAAALEWLADQSWEASTDAYSSGFYVTYLLAAVAAIQDDFPAALRDRMRAMLLAEQDADGSFEGRTIDDDPSAVVATALALETAVALDDDALDPLVRRAATFLLRHFDDGHWRGGRYYEGHPQDVSLFATVHAARALAMAERRAAGTPPAACATARR